MHQNRKVKTKQTREVSQGQAMKENVDRIVISPDLVEFQELNFTCALKREDRTAILFEKYMCIRIFLHLGGHHPLVSSCCIINTLPLYFQSEK